MGIANLTATTTQLNWKFTDSYKHKGQRAQLAEQLWQKGISDRRVLAAIRKIPRHFFIDDAFSDFAYQDKPFPIGEGQTISQPYTVAYQTQLLQVGEAHKVLEIGTGSGYQSAVLLELGAILHTIECQAKLHKNATFLLKKLGYTAHLLLGDGTLGWEANAPYDRILVTAGAPHIPRALKNQLNIGGVLVIPVGKSATQKMLRITRISEAEFAEEVLGNFAFVPLIGKQGWRRKP